MRQLLPAALVIAIALGGAVYVASLRLGSHQFFIDGVTCRHAAPKPCGGLVPADPSLAGIPRTRAGWQLPASILIGVLGVAGGLVVRRTGPNPRRGNSTRAA